MRIAVLGTGQAGRTIATKLVDIGHQVRMGSRTPDNETARVWSTEHGDAASDGSFAEAAGFGEIALNCTAGAGAIDAVTSAARGLEGKLLIDVCNPLDFSGPTPTLFVGITDSLGEQIQRALPNTSVVKALNTMNADVMVAPGLVPGDHVTFICGDNEAAKATTAELLGQFGWTAERIVDCGDISGARATESFLLLWLRTMRTVGHSHFNIAVSRAPD